MNYGLPYKGSKRKLAERIVRLLPPAAHFYDLFCGGGAITHCALTMPGKYGTVHMNDFDPRMPALFKDAISGTIPYDRLYKWVSREDFQMFAPHDGLIATCWSFGNNCKNYLYDDVRERIYSSANRLIFSPDAETRRSAFISFCDSLESLIGDVCQEYEKHHEWLDEQKQWREHNEAPRGLMEKNRRTWEIAMMRTEVMMPLIKYFVEALNQCPVRMKDIEQHLGTQMAGHYFTTGSQWVLPTAAHYARLQQVVPALKREYDERKPMFDWLQTGKTNNERALENLRQIPNITNLNLVDQMKCPSLCNRLETSSGDYQSVQILPDSVIYCDPPYKGTDDYVEGGDFDYERFYEWCCNQSSPVFISEYNMPADRFRCIAEFDHRSSLARNVNNAVTERLFIPINQKYGIETEKSIFDFETFDEYGEDEDTDIGETN